MFDLMPFCQRRLRRPPQEAAGVAPHEGGADGGDPERGPEGEGSAPGAPSEGADAGGGGRCSAEGGNPAAAEPRGVAGGGPAETGGGAQGEEPGLQEGQRSTRTSTTAPTPVPSATYNQIHSDPHWDSPRCACRHVTQISDASVLGSLDRTS